MKFFTAISTRDCGQTKRRFPRTDETRISAFLFRDSGLSRIQGASRCVVAELVGGDVAVVVESDGDKCCSAL